MSDHTASERFSQHIREARVFRRLMLIVALILVGLQVFSWVGDESDDAERAALAIGVDRLSRQVEQLGGNPVVPSSGEIKANPDSVISAPPPEPVDAEMLREAIDSAMSELLPGEVSESVRQYVDMCVESGDCVGPTGPPGAAGPQGAPGAPPSPGQVAAAVLDVCATELDCVVTDDEIAQAVADYCGQASQPCGHRWSEKDIYDIAKKAAGSFRVSCPPPVEILAHPHDRFTCVLQE